MSARDDVYGFSERVEPRASENRGPANSAFKQLDDDRTTKFRRWEGLREMAKNVLGVDIVLTPESSGLHIRVRKYIDDVGITYNCQSFFVSQHEIDQAVIDVVALNILQGIKDVGGFDGLH